jgi:hypothetical protein
MHPMGYGTGPNHASAEGPIRPAKDTEAALRLSGIITSDAGDSFVA